MARIPIAPPGMKDQRPRYTLGWRVGNHIYVAGQLPFDKDGNLLGKGDIKAQTKWCLEDIDRTLKAAGTSLQHAASINVYLKNPGDFAAMNEVYRTFFKENPPARTTIGRAVDAVGTPGK